MQYGRYRIVKELGKGSMGVVYQAHDPHIDRLDALKVLRPDRVSSDAFVRRFMREAKAIGRLSHPGIVVVYDIGEDHGTVYISMELLEGQPLHTRIESGKFSIEEIIEIGAQIGEALDYAHQKGIVHRDIKPSNIVIQPGGHAKITDFGIASIEDPEATQQTQAGEILGTPAYMSPEQVRGEHVDGRSDIFSLGVVLYEMSTGNRPFKGENIAAVFRNLVTEKPPDPAQLNPDVLPELSAVIMKCIAKSPGDRFPSGKELADALLRCRPRRPSPERSDPPVQSARRGRVPLILAMAVLLLSAALAGYWFRQAPDRPVTRTTTSTDPAEVGPKVPAASTSTDKPPGGPALLYGYLTIETVPAGAGIMVDGVDKGVSPLKLELTAGSHEVKLSLAQHYDWEAQVRVAAEKELNIPVELIPLD